jgi:hypothetical protein
MLEEMGCVHGTQKVSAITLFNEYVKCIEKNTGLPKDIVCVLLSYIHSRHLMKHHWICGYGINVDIILCFECLANGADNCRYKYAISCTCGYCHIPTNEAYDSLIIENHLITYNRKKYNIMFFSPSSARAKSLIPREFDKDRV